MLEPKNEKESEKKKGTTKNNHDPKTPSEYTVP